MEQVNLELLQAFGEIVSDVVEEDDCPTQPFRRVYRSNEIDPTTSQSHCAHWSNKY